ncbi:MAG: class I SAM-dependent methyltransferase [Lachnospiraceae bacterium]
MEENYLDYHKLRLNVFTKEAWIPGCVIEHLPSEKSANILDIGCGDGRMLSALRNLGYENIHGIDLDESAVEWVRKKGIDCEKIDLLEYHPEKKFDFIIMNHVVEHIPKKDVISTLNYIYSNLLNDNGKMYTGVPNAQSNVGCYWAYEDFTHETLYTSGSISYVLRAAGFEQVDFLDRDGSYDLKGIKKIIMKAAVFFYDKRVAFYNKITESYFHKPSPRIYTWELKVLAQKVR